VQAAKALAKIGAPAVPELIKALDDPSETVRIRALLILGTIGREARLAVMPVAKLLEHKDARFRLLAALVLGAMHEEGRPAAKLLANALRDQEPKIRFVAADSLYQIGPPAIPFLIAAAKDVNGEIRIQAFRTLGRFLESEEALEALAVGLKDKDRKVRAVAAASLSRLGAFAKSTLAKLLESLEENDLDLQVNAFTAVMGLGMHRDKDLREALTSLNEKNRWAEKKPFGPDEKKTLVTFLNSPNPTRRLVATLALERSGASPQQAFPVLERMQKDSSLAVRAGAILAKAAIAPLDKVNFQKLDEYIRDSLLDAKVDRQELIRLHILLSAMPSFISPGQSPKKELQKSFEKNKKMICRLVDDAEFKLDDIPVLVEGINLAAQFNLGFTEPFSRLSFRLQNLVQESDDPKVAVLAFTNLGKGVRPGSYYWPAIQRQWTQVLAKVPVEFMILEKQQSIQQQERLQTQLLSFPMIQDMQNSWTGPLSRKSPSASIRDKSRLQQARASWFSNSGLPLRVAAIYGQLHGFA
jgi:HEAT repeat protein